MLAASLVSICSATSSYIEPWTLKWEQFPKDSSSSATSRNNMILQLLLYSSRDCISHFSHFSQNCVSHFRLY